MKARYSNFREGLQGGVRCPHCERFDRFIILDKIGKDKSSAYYCSHCFNLITFIK